MLHPHTDGEALSHVTRFGSAKMGAANSTQSRAAEQFATLYEALPDDVHDQIEALVAKDDMRLLKPHPSAPPPFPTLLIGVTCRLSQQVAATALATVPRLQRKHYEMIPKSLTELDFFISFFSHMTAIVDRNCPGAMTPEEVGTEWKDVDEREGSDSFEAAWTALPDNKKLACAALAEKTSDTLLQPNPSAPPAFPTLPLGMECFIDENAARSALSTVPGLQYKHYCVRSPRIAPSPDAPLPPLLRAAWPPREPSLTTRLLARRAADGSQEARREELLGQLF